MRMPQFYLEGSILRIKEVTPIVSELVEKLSNLKPYEVQRLAQKVYNVEILTHLKDLTFQGGDETKDEQVVREYLEDELIKCEEVIDKEIVMLKAGKRPLSVVDLALSMTTITFWLFRIQQFNERKSAA